MGWQAIASKLNPVTSGNEEQDDQIRLGQPALLQIVSKSKGQIHFSNW